MIKHVKGDIFQSEADVILHQVNCQGVMGSGVALQIKTNYPIVYETYKELCDVNSIYGGEPKDLLGTAQPVKATDNLTIINIFAQENYGYDGACYTSYESLRAGLEFVRDNYKNSTIAIPYLMGCHRGGGDWLTVFKMIEEIFINCDVTLYEYNGG